MPLQFVSEDERGAAASSFVDAGCSEVNASCEDGIQVAGSNRGKVNVAGEADNEVANVTPPGVESVEQLPPSLTGTVIDSPQTSMAKLQILSPDEFDPQEVSELKALLPTLRRIREAQLNSYASPTMARLGSTTDSTASTEFVTLSKDTYSVMFATEPRSSAFFFAIGVFIFQILILVLLLVDIVDPSSRDNPHQIPAGVGTAVRTAQFLAMLIAVATQDDVITSINAIHDGYPGEWMQREVGATLWQWILSVSCRFIEGAFCLSVTFILIVQSSAVIELFLDFLAMTFVSTLDDICFDLACDGYFSRRLKREAKDVSEVRVPQAAFSVHKFRPVLFFVVFAGMVAGWSVIVHKQNSGEYMSTRVIAVQFGDSFAPQLAYFSGIYEMSPSNEIVQKRPVFVEKGPGRHHGQAMFAYCEDEKAWTFSYAASEGAEPDPCNWQAKSRETEAYDIMEISSSEWFVLGAESSSAVPFAHFSYQRADCNQDTERGLCSHAGRCEDNRCVCDEGRYGLHCQFQEPCNPVEVDTSREGFPGGISTKYSILHRSDGTKAMVYERPVFVANSTITGFYDIIFFTGRRWLVASTTRFENNTKTRTIAGLAEFLISDFHAYWSNFTADFGSAPMDMNTPADSMSPVGLRWYRTKTFNDAVDVNRPLPTLLLCSKCHDDRNPCDNGGTCVNGTCECNYGTFGALCQVSDFVLCRSVAVQYGDEVRSSLGAFSGVYDIGNNTISGRAVYYERRNQNVMFAYCEESKTWTFAEAWHPADNVTNEEKHCTDWIAMSATTDTYDLTTVTSGWVVRRIDDAEEGVPLLYYNLRCNDCDPDDKKSCSGSGKCVENQCVCNPDRYGLSCELRDPCRQIEVDSSKEGFPGILSAQYKLLTYNNGTDIKVYERPVYVSNTTGGSFDMIVFVGRRWLMTNSESHALLGNATTREELAGYLSSSFHGYFSNYMIDYMSEPADVNTLVDTPSPVDLAWFGTKSFDNKQVDLNQPVETSLLCSFCDDVDYVCYNGGDCRIEGNGTEGKCACLFGTFGTFCQVHSLCERMSVQFGPELGQTLFALSGTYGLSNRTFSGRPVYFLQQENNTFGNAMFAYCGVEKSWTFTPGPFDDITDDQVPCSRWMVKSTASHTYDITTLSSWFITQNGTFGELVPLSFFTLSCIVEAFPLG